MKDYMITDDTLAIIPFGRGKSTILEMNDVFDVELSPRMILKKNSLMYGCSYDGRKESYNYVTGSCYKSPIILSEKNCLLLFPTASPRVNTCSWINLVNIKNILKDGRTGYGLIEFKNGYILELDISFYVLNNQYNRALRLILSNEKTN